MRRANATSAFLTGIAIGVPIILVPQITSSHLAVRCLISMVCLGYMALWMIFVGGPMEWVRWTFRLQGGMFEPLPRMLAWLAGTGVSSALLASVGWMPYQ